MEIQLAVVHHRRTGPGGAAGEMVQGYMDRAGRYCPCSCRSYATEERLLAAVEAGAGRAGSGRGRAVLMLADSRGETVTSEALAAEVSARMDTGSQLLVVGIGPADGWSNAAMRRADRTISFGRVTLPHELAAVVAAEQIYRALTIRAGHPYHSGH